MHLATGGFLDLATLLAGMAGYLLVSGSKLSHASPSEEAGPATASP